jgi:hypothetical protein
MKINWKRLIWVFFVCIYSALFFFNCLKPFGNWLIPYIYTMVLIIWLAYEYYKRNIFFQSGSIPDALYFWLPRALFALFFYSSFVVGIATIIWWPKNQIGLYPFINIIGLGILGISIYKRLTLFQTEKADQNANRGFYLSVALLTVSLAFGYGSQFLLVYVFVIGLPLIYWNYAYEKRVLTHFAAYMQKQGVGGSKQVDYAKLWEKYLASKTVKPKQK